MPTKKKILTKEKIKDILTKGVLGQRAMFSHLAHKGEGKFDKKKQEFTYKSKTYKVKKNG